MLVRSLDIIFDLRRSPNLQKLLKFNFGDQQNFRTSTKYASQTAPYQSLGISTSVFTAEVNVFQLAHRTYNRFPLIFLSYRGPLLNEFNYSTHPHTSTYSLSFIIISDVSLRKKKLLKLLCNISQSGPVPKYWCYIY